MMFPVRQSYVNPFGLLNVSRLWTGKDERGWSACFNHTGVSLDEE